MSGNPGLDPNSVPVNAGDVIMVMRLARQSNGFIDPSLAAFTMPRPRRNGNMVDFTLTGGFPQRARYVLTFEGVFDITGEPDEVEELTAHLVTKDGEGTRVEVDLSDPDSLSTVWLTDEAEQVRQLIAAIRAQALGMLMSEVVAREEP